MALRIATMEGTFLAPGVSANKRLYTPEMVTKAVAELQGQLRSGKSVPVTMLTGHPEEGNAEDITKVVGGVREVWMDRGRAKFRADIPDTLRGRDVAALTAGDRPFVGAVSIRGNWMGKMRTVATESGRATTAEGIRIRGLDFTTSPGVPEAAIEGVTLEEAAAAHPEESEVDERDRLVVESVDVEFTEVDGRQIDPKESADTCANCGQKITESQETKVPETDEPKEQESQQAPARNLTEADVDAIVSKLRERQDEPKQAEPVKETTTAAPDISEAVRQAVAAEREALKESIVSEVRSQVVKEYGPPRRKGLVENVENPEKAPHQMTDEEWRVYRAQLADTLLPTPLAPAEVSSGA